MANKISNFKLKISGNLGKSLKQVFSYDFIYLGNMWHIWMSDMVQKECKQGQLPKQVLYDVTGKTPFDCVV